MSSPRRNFKTEEKQFTFDVLHITRMGPNARPFQGPAGIRLGESNFFSERRAALKRKSCRGNRVSTFQIAGRGRGAGGPLRLVDILSVLLREI